MLGRACQEDAAGTRVRSDAQREPSRGKNAPSKERRSRPIKFFSRIFRFKFGGKSEIYFQAYPITNIKPSSLKTKTHKRHNYFYSPPISWYHTFTTYFSSTIHSHCQTIIMVYVVVSTNPISSINNDNLVIFRLLQMPQKFTYTRRGQTCPKRSGLSM